MNESKARYVLANIITSDLELINRSKAVRSKGVTHEEIYRVGLDEIEKRGKK